MIGITVYVVSDTVVADIRNDKQILTADGFVENSLAFTGSKTGTFYTILRGATGIAFSISCVLAMISSETTNFTLYL